MKAGVSSTAMHQCLSCHAAKGIIWSGRTKLVEAHLEHSSCTAALVTDPWSLSWVDEKRNGMWGGDPEG